MSDWIEWYGDGRPVAADTMVEVRFRDGQMSIGKAGTWDMRWNHQSVPADIVAYRVVDVSPLPDGWIEWTGGLCPVPADTLVEYRLRTKQIVTNTAGVLRWQHRHTMGDIVAYRVVGVAPAAAPSSALNAQEGGSHYKTLAIQPVEYIHKNGIGYFEGNVIKYVTRWKAKGGVADLKKARHYLDLLIELEGVAP